MNPLSLHCRNYRSFEVLDVDLPTGCVAIIGPNGAGKSTLVNGIPVAIFGSEGRSLADEQTDFAVDDLLLELEVEHAGRMYRIRRTFSSRGRGKPTLDFERYDGVDEVMEWGPLTCASIQATQDLIEETFGLSRTTFLASAFLAQGRGALFCDASPRDRLRILSEIINLSKWDDALVRVRADKEGLQKRHVELSHSILQAEETAAAKPSLERQRDDVVEAETVSADNVADLERSHAELAAEYQAARSHADRRDKALAELSAAQVTLVSLKARDEEATKAAHAHAEALAELEQLPSYPPLDELRARETVLAAAVEAHAQAVRDHEAATRLVAERERERDACLNRAIESDAAAAAVRKQIFELEQAAEPTCPTCEQKLPDDAKQRAIAFYQDDLVKHIEKANREREAAGAVESPAVPAPPLDDPPTVERDLARKTIDAVGAVTAQRAVLEERLKQSETVAASGPSPDALFAAHTLELEKRDAVTLVGEPPNLAAITLRGNEVSEQLKTSRTQLDGYRQQRARLDERLLIATAAEASLAEHAAERRTLDEQLDDVLTLERAFQPNGVPALILENTAIPYIEVEAQKVLARLGGKTAAARLELRTQRARKSGDGVMDALDVVVTTEQGGEREYHNWSGGEQMRIDFALRYALAKLLYSRGADSGVFVIDEPEGLDRDGKAALIELLREMEAEGVGRVYLISHDADLAESFDQTIVVAADGASSRIDGAGVYAEAAA